MMLRATVAFVIGVAITKTQTPPPAPQPPQATPAAPASLEVGWRFDLTAAEEGQPVPWLVPGDTRVFVSGPRTGVSAHDAIDGKIAWTSDEPSAIPPVIAGSNVVLVGESELRVLDQKTGQVRFSAAIQGLPALSFSVFDRIGVVVDGGIRAWDLKGAEAWRAKLSNKPVTNVVMAGNVLVLGTDEPALVAFEIATGAESWKIPLTTRPSALAATTERIYFGGDDGRLYSYRASGDPKRAWRQIRHRAIGQPIVDGTSVFFALLDNSVRAFGADGGTQRSDEVVESRPLTGPLRLTDSLGVALTNGRVVELSPKTGKRLGPASAMTTGSVRLLTAAAAPDGSRLYTITIANDLSRTLAAWARPPSPPGFGGQGR